MSDQANLTLPLLPYTLSFPTGKIKSSSVSEDRERKNGTFRFSAAAGKTGFLYLGDTYLSRVTVNGQGTGFSVNGEKNRGDVDGLKARLARASLRLSVSAGYAWIAPDQGPLKGGTLVQMDADPGEPFMLVFRDSGFAIGEGEVVIIDGFWGLRITGMYGEPKAPPSLKGFIQTEVPLGSLPLTVEELMTVGEGSILQLDTLSTRPLALVSGGTPLAEGTLHVYRDLAPSLTQTFTREIRSGNGKLFFRVWGRGAAGYRTPDCLDPDGLPPDRSQASADHGIPTVFQFLRYLPSERLHGYLDTVSVDLAAFILKCLVSQPGEEEKGGELLRRLSARPGFIRRFILCNPVRSAIHLDGIIAAELSGVCGEGELEMIAAERVTPFEDPYNPVRTAAGAMVSMDIASQSDLLLRLKGEDEELYGEFRRFFFLMEDIVLLDDRAIQKLLREIDYDVLARIFSRSDDRIKEKILGNMSKRGGLMLQEEIDLLGKTPDDVYDAAAKKLLDILRRLVESGEIAL